jgi:hypothetical protein
VAGWCEHVNEPSGPWSSLVKTEGPREKRGKESKKARKKERKIEFHFLG